MASLDIPNQLYISRALYSESLQYRGNDKELWTIATIRPAFMSAEDRLSHENMIHKKESYLKSMADRYTKSGIPNQFMRKDLTHGGVLLILSMQAPRNKMMYSEIDFDAFWSDGSRVTGTIEWPGNLESKVESYVRHLETIQLTGGLKSETIIRDRPQLTGDAQ